MSPSGRFHTVTTQQRTPDSVHTSLSHVQNGEPCPRAFPKDSVHCKPVSALGENGLTKTDFPSVASQNKIAVPTEGNLIVLLHDFYYGQHIGDGQPEPKTHTAFKCCSCLKVLKNVEFTCLRKGTPLASRVAQGVSGPSSSCVWNPRVFADDARGWQCDEDLREPLVRRQGSQVSMRVARGSEALRR